MISYKKYILRNTLLICIMFSLLLIASFYYFQYNTSKKQYIGEAERYINNLAENLDDAVSKINDLPIIFNTNKDLETYIESPGITSYQRGSVHKFLSSAVSAMSSIKGEIAIINPADTYFVSSNAIVRPDFFLNNYGISASDLEDVMGSNTKYSIPSIFFTNVNGVNYLTVMVKDKKSFSKPYLIALVYNLDRLKGSVPYDATLLINSNDSHVLFADPENAKALKDLPSGKIPQKYTVLYKKTAYKSAAGALTYTLVLERTKYLSSINHFIAYILPLSVIFFALSYILAGFAASRSYKPITKILDQINSIDPSEENNEIEHIYSAVSLLINHNKKLLEQSDTNETALREKFIDDLMHNKLTKVQADYGINSYLKQDKYKPPCSLVVFSIESAGDGTVLNANNLPIYYDMIKELFEQSFTNDILYFSAIVPSVYCTLLSGFDEKTLRSELQNIFLAAETDIYISLSATIGNQINDWHALPSAFTSAYITHTTAMASKTPYSIVNNNDLDISFFYSSELDEQIYKYCISSDKNALENTITTLLDKNFPNDEMFEKNSSAISLLLYALCTRIMATLNIKQEDVFADGYNVYLELKAAKDKDDFLRKALFSFNSIINYNADSKTAYEQSNCDKMISFVHENYDKDISLTDIAKHMNMSQAYVSRLFKKLVHCNFKDYLSKVRLDNAVRLLIENPEKTVQEISGMVGFNTPRTFTNTFSAAYGMTPTEYRHKHLTH